MDGHGRSMWVHRRRHTISCQLRMHAMYLESRDGMNLCRAHVHVNAQGFPTAQWLLGGEQVAQAGMIISSCPFSLMAC